MAGLPELHRHGDRVYSHLYQLTADELAEINIVPAPDGATLPPPPAKRVLSPHEFKSLSTPQERIAARKAAHEQTDLGFALDDVLDMLQTAKEVDLDHPQTIAGVQLMVQAGIYSPERAEQILAGTPPQS
jgi:hypothetical protein